MVPIVTRRQKGISIYFKKITSYTPVSPSWRYISMNYSGLVWCEQQFIPSKWVYHLSLREIQCSPSRGLSLCLLLEIEVSYIVDKWCASLLGGDICGRWMNVESFRRVLHYKIKERNAQSTTEFDYQWSYLDWPKLPKSCLRFILCVSQSIMANSPLHPVRKYAK